MLFARSQAKLLSWKRCLTTFDSFKGFMKVKRLICIKKLSLLFSLEYFVFGTKDTHSIKNTPNPTYTTNFLWDLTRLIDWYTIHYSKQKKSVLRQKPGVAAAAQITVWTNYTNLLVVSHTWNKCVCETQKMTRKSSLRINLINRRWGKKKI